MRQVLHVFRYRHKTCVAASLTRSIVYYYYVVLQYVATRITRGSKVFGRDFCLLLLID